MSDQLSKVECDACGGVGAHRTAGRNAVLDDWRTCETCEGTGRIESAAAPAEVDHFAASWRGDWNSTMRGYAEEYARRVNATLARQLAYSEEANANLKTMCAAAEARAESALAAATRRVAEVEEVLRQIDAYHGPIRTPIHTITKLRGMARAALQKEPDNGSSS